MRPSLGVLVVAIQVDLDACADLQFLAMWMGAATKWMAASRNGARNVVHDSTFLTCGDGVMLHWMSQ